MTTRSLRALRMLLTALVLSLTACAGSPTAPSSVEAATPPLRALHSEVPLLSFVAEHGRTVGTLDGGIAYLCRTQPRVYESVEGRVETVIDWYVESTACPVVPID